MKILTFIFLFLFIINSINSNDKETYFQEIESLSNATFITQILDKENYNLYIVTGESSINKKNNYIRKIMIFDISGALIENSTFSAKYGFDNPVIDYFNVNNDKYLLIITETSIELFNIREKTILQSISNTFDGYAPILLKTKNWEYAYIYEQEFGENYLMIKNILLNLNNIDGYISTQVYRKEPIAFGDEILSCDKTYDNNYVICAYIKYEEDTEIELSAYEVKFDYEKINSKIIERSPTLLDSYFLKILYFKDNDKFIIVSSYDDTTSHLRYYKYKNNFFINQIFFISDDENDYVNLTNTHLSPFYEYNDIIILNTNKVAQISAFSNKILLTLFSFLNDDTKLVVRTFQFKENTEYTDFINPRISLINNIITVSLSGSKRKENKVGFFFINYPRAINSTIEDTKKIKVSDLALVESNLLGFEPYIKIVELPEHFIFYNLLNETVLNGAYLYMNDSLVFKQYKKGNIYNLKYQVFSKGNNSQYTTIKVYPPDSSNSLLPLNEQISIEGGIGVLKININNCNNEFLPTDDNNICTSITPDGYYRNEKEKIFEKCHKNCKTCYGDYIEDKNYSFMNCSACLDGYNRTEDTYSCYNSLPPQYFLDGNVFKKCSSNCSTCYGREETNCLTCLENFTFFLQHNICIFNDDIDKIKVNQKIQSQYRVLFIIIFIISIIVGIIIVFRPIYKEEIEVSRFTFREIQKGDEKDKNIPLQEMPLLNW